MTIILGIDPGTARLGYAIIELLEKPSLIDCGIISTSKDDTDAQRLKEIRQDLAEIIKTHKPDLASVEKLFFFKNPKTIIPVAQARGVILEVAATHGLEVFEYTPLEMKKTITGNGMAKKDMVSEIIHRELGLSEQIKPDDAVDAVGLAFTYIRMSHHFNQAKPLAQK